MGYGPRSYVNRCGVVLGTINGDARRRRGAAAGDAVGGEVRGGGVSLSPPDVCEAVPACHPPATNTPTGDDGIYSVPAAPSVAAPIGSPTLKAPESNDRRHAKTGSNPADRQAAG